MAGLLESLIRRAAPGGYQETPEEQYRKSVMSPDYVPETSGRNVLYGGIRGLLDATPAGLLDAAQAGLNRLPTAGGAFVRAITGRAQGPVDAGMGLLGMQGSGPGYEAGRAASGAAVSGMGLLGNQAGGQLPRGYARDQSGAIVWHGSPHKFDKFDSSKIGTGEGAQAYGHGLYLAEAKDVARTYQQKLSGMLGNPGNAVMVDGVPLSAGSKAERRAYEIIARDGWKNAKSTELALRKEGADTSALQAALAATKGKGVSIARDNGALYKVDLPDEQIAKMLDWDKPLSQQSDAVKQLLPKLNDWQRSMLDNPQFRAAWKNKFDNAQTGGVTYGELMRERGGQVAASDYLRDLGIPGIRYLDSGSLGHGAGTSNFVVFPGNEGLLKILSRE